MRISDFRDTGWDQTPGFSAMGRNVEAIAMRNALRLVCMAEFYRDLD